ncbi:hypothetical protein ACFFWD_33655 [Bradyrhizobium erythrophlei]|uniref:hypothetical protein n=1 Tax=Bradyrhizobium erythrophlei TaxID=1437360 RepID=UPI0035ED8E8E
MLDGATPVKAAADGQVTIPQAAHRAFCMSEHIVRLVLDGMTPITTIGSSM